MSKKVFYVQIHPGMWLYQAHMQAESKEEVMEEVQRLFPGKERVNIYECDQEEAEKYFPTEQQEA